MLGLIWNQTVRYADDIPETYFEGKNVFAKKISSQDLS